MITPQIPYIFENKHEHKFEMSIAVLDRMIQFIQHVPEKHEAGGVMLGRFIVGSDDVVVDKITVPMIGDKRSRFRFFRSRNPHQTVIGQEWEASGGTCNYLGEWHTHPEPNPEPSFVDLAGWKKKLAFDQFDSGCLYFVIVGTERVNAWQGYRKSLRIEALKRIQ